MTFPVSWTQASATVSAAQGVSPDGSSVVGVSTAGPSGGRAFLWTELAGMTDLGDLPGGISSSSAWAVSNNGVAIGKSYSAAGREAFRWTSDGGMQGLGFLPGSTSSEAVAISADGSVIGGQSLYVAKLLICYRERTAFLFERRSSLRADRRKGRSPAAGTGPCNRCRNR